MKEYKYPEVLRELIEQKNITVCHLAAELGLGLNTLYNHTNGRVKPSIEILIMLRDYFKVSIDYLLCGGDE